MEERGSYKLVDRCPQLVQLDSLEKLTDVVQSSDAQLVRWWCYGQPEPDGVAGSVHVRNPKTVGELLGRLIDIEELLLDFEVFPLGIPVPELFEIRFQTPGSRG